MKSNTSYGSTALVQRMIHMNHRRTCHSTSFQVIGNARKGTIDACHTCSSLFPHITSKASSVKRVGIFRRHTRCVRTFTSITTYVYIPVDVQTSDYTITDMNKGHNIRVRHNIHVQKHNRLLCISSSALFLLLIYACSKWNYT